MVPVLRSTDSLLEQGLSESIYPDPFVRLTDGHLNTMRIYTNNTAQKYIFTFRGMTAPRPYEEWRGTFEGIHTNHQKLLRWGVDAIYAAVAPVEEVHRLLNMAYMAIVDVIDQSPPTRNMTRTEDENHKKATRAVESQKEKVV